MSANQETLLGSPSAAVNPSVMLEKLEPSAASEGSEMPSLTMAADRLNAGTRQAAEKRPATARRKYVKKPKKPPMPMKISYLQGVATSPHGSMTHQRLLNTDMPVLTPEQPLPTQLIRQRAVQSQLASANLMSKMVQSARKAQSARMVQGPRMSGGSLLPGSTVVSPAASHRSTCLSYRSAGSPPSDQAVRASEAYKLSVHINYLSGFSRPPDNLVCREHTYSKPLNWHPDHFYVRPTRYLFAEKPTSTRLLQKELWSSDDNLDIESVDFESSMPRNEAWKSSDVEPVQVEPAHSDDEDEPTWDENISREGWSASQTRLFGCAVASLEALELRRIVCRATPSEFITMQTAYAMHANDLRYQLVACYNDYRLPVWLHLLLVTRLPAEFKAHYAQLLARMRPAIPHIVDVMVKTPLPPLAGARITAATAVTPNIELPPLEGDTVAEQLIREKFKRLPNSPVFLVIPEDHRTYRKPRFILFTSMLSQMGQTFTVQHTQAPDGATILQGLDHKMAEARGKLIELRSKLPGRQVVLVGFNTGAALAAQLALMEPVFAVICLGFPLATVSGRRGEPDDAILTLRCPALFVIGEHAHTVSAAQLDPMRWRMVVHTQLVVLGMCDDNLVMPRQRMLDLKITQPMVDKSILVEIHTFLGQQLTNPTAPTVYTKSKMAAVYKRSSMAKQSQGGGDDTSLKTTTRRYVKKQKNFQAQTKRKPRVTATQQLMINSAKYASELPPDYAAQLQDSQLAPGLWQSKYKSPMLSPTKQAPSPQSGVSAPGSAASDPPPMSASSVFITPSVPGTSTAPTQSVKVISSSPSIRAPRKSPVTVTTASAPLIASSLPTGCFSLSNRGNPAGNMVTVLNPRPKLVMIGHDKSAVAANKVVTVTSRGPRPTTTQALTADNILNLPIIFAKDNDNMFQVNKTDLPTTMQETHKIVNKFEFSKPQPGVKYRKIFLTRMPQPPSSESSFKPGIKTITIQPNAIVDNVQAVGATGILGRQLCAPRGAPRMLGPVRHAGPGRPPGRQVGPGRPPGPGRGRMGRGGQVRAHVAPPVQAVPMTDDLKFEVFLEDLDEDAAKRGVKTKGTPVRYEDSSPKKSCP